MMQCEAQCQSGKGHVTVCGMMHTVLCRMKLAEDDDSGDEGGWDADGDAPTLGELPVLPQVEEAHKAPWQLSGGRCATSWAGVRMARST